MLRMIYWTTLINWMYVHHTTREREQQHQKRTRTATPKGKAYSLSRARQASSRNALVSPGRIISETRETVEFNLEQTVRNNADQLKAI